ncbi:MAG TPA: hypothetical protein ENK57_04615 [Polyangiaceae bacterium]|nr:hypothetical protein [Polyangiaceae bacterium]
MSDDRDAADPPESLDDGARRVILARRRRFVALALTSAGVAASACDSKPFVCLEPPPVPSSAQPQPRLEPTGGPCPWC